MNRRKFLVGVGSAAAAGSAVLGSGAFTRVEAQRSVTVQVAEDPNAYLGMDKCSIGGSTTPNSSYAHLDDDGHLKIFMDDENPTIGESPLGDGINSDSTSWFDNVFEICNQGKEDACVWIEDNENWPTVGEDAEGVDGVEPGDRRVDFYLGDDDSRSIVGEANAIGVPLGECICVGLKTRSYGLSEGDKVLEQLDNEIRIIADVNGLCFADPEEECPIYGITQGTGTQSLNAIGVPNFSDTELVTDLPGYDEDQEFYPNGLAFDDEDGMWYFSTGDPADLIRTDGFTFDNLGDLTPGRVAGAAWFVEGNYYYVPQNSTELYRADTSANEELVGDLSDFGIGTIGLGDVAIQSAEEVYISTSQSGDGARFIDLEIDTTAPDIVSATVVADEADSGTTLADHAVNKQIAFDPDGTLYAHQSGSDTGLNGNWYTVDDLTTAETTLEAELEEEYTDLAQCAFPPAFTDF